jgi:hypothetical protein
MMLSATAPEEYAVQELTTEQTRQKFDDMVLKSLGITSDQFVKNYCNGDYDDRDECDLIRILMLLPFTGYIQEYGERQSNCGE